MTLIGNENSQRFSSDKFKKTSVPVKASLFIYMKEIDKVHGTSRFICQQNNIKQFQLG